MPRLCKNQGTVKTYGTSVETTHLPTECHPRMVGPYLGTDVYALLEPNPFQDPTDPGAVAVYTQFVTQSMIKMANTIFTRAQNKWNLYRNIQ